MKQIKLLQWKLEGKLEVKGVEKYVFKKRYIKGKGWKNYVKYRNSNSKMVRKHTNNAQNLK